MWPLVALVLGLGCGSGEPKPETGETGETGDSGGDSALPETGIVRVQVDAGRLEDVDLVVWTYEVRDLGYASNDDEAPRFHLVVNEERVSAGEPQPLLVWLHGGVSGIPDDEEFGTFCSMYAEANKGSTLLEIIQGAVDSHGNLWSLADQRGWMIAIPESTWCDHWAGRGADDPMNPTNYSLVHIETILDALTDGLDGVQADSSAVYAWGTSIGGAGVFPVAYGLDGQSSRFAGVVADSGPVSLTEWYETDYYRPVVEHLVGGAAYDEKTGEATEYMSAYSLIDGPLLIQQNGFRVPVFSAYNTYDTLTTVQHGDNLEAALETHYGADGARYFSHDFQHYAPGERYHTQTQGSYVPWLYTAESAFSFLEGREVRFLEAESFCDEGVCALIQETDADADENASSFSLGGVVKKEPKDGFGTLFSGTLPDDLPRGVEIELLVITKATGLQSSNNDLLVTDMTVWSEGNAVVAHRRLNAMDFAPEGEASLAQHQAQVEATRFSMTLPEDGDHWLEMTYEARGTVYLDGFWVLN